MTFDHRKTITNWMSPSPWNHRKPRLSAPTRVQNHVQNLSNYLETTKNHQKNKTIQNKRRCFKPSWKHFTKNRLQSHPPAFSGRPKDTWSLKDTVLGQRNYAALWWSHSVFFLHVSLLLPLVLVSQSKVKAECGGFLEPPVELLETFPVQLSACLLCQVRFTKTLKWAITQFFVQRPIVVK